MKSLTAIALFVATGIATAGCALAQDKVTANVPFNFTVNGRTLPAGSYSMGHGINAARMLTIAGGKGVGAVTAITVADSAAPGDSKLVFHHYGTQYFLREIRTSDSSMSCHLTASKQEKWAKAQTQEASVRGNSDVLVALK